MSVNSNPTQQHLNKIRKNFMSENSSHLPTVSLIPVNGGDHPLRWNISANFRKNLKWLRFGLALADYHGLRGHNRLVYTAG